MPQTKLEKFVFGIFMSYFMAYGMEVYNNAWKEGIPLSAGGFSNLRNGVFLAALKETVFMGVIAYIVSELWGNRIGHMLAARFSNPKTDPKFFCTLMMSGCTVFIMCPSMSLIASVLFSVILGGVPLSQLPAVWVGSVIKNFPMAFFWNIFAAAPLTRTVFAKLFRREKSAVTVTSAPVAAKR
jgi:hypothetical protein